MPKVICGREMEAGLFNAKTANHPYGHVLS